MTHDQRKLVCLSDILTRSQERTTIEPEQMYQQITVRLWGKGVVERGTIAGSQIAATSQFVARPGQFIVSRIDARNGAFGLVPDDLDGAIVTNDFPLFTINPEKVSPEFLEWMSKTQRFVDLCIAASEGTTNRVRLQEARFLATEIPLPPLDEQRRIVARIEALAGRVAEAQRLRVAALAAGNQLISSLHQELAGDRIVRLDEILTLDEVKVPVIAGGTYPQVGVRGFGNGLFVKEATAADQTSYKYFNQLYPGALVLSQVKGWEGALAVAAESLAGKFVSPEYRTFRCIANMASSDYLARLVVTPWFWSKLAQVERGMGGRRQRTRPEQFLALEVSMPTYEQQLKALPILSRLDKIAPLQAATQVELEALVPAILDQAFRGEL